MDSKSLRKYTQSAMTFTDFENMVGELLEQGKTTGTNQSEAMVGYGKLNRQRMNRLEKTIVINDAIRLSIAANEREMIWLIITEGWCGDAAQNVPVIEKIAAESGKIDTRYILRDENLELMDEFLTGGARSIPKLIAIDPLTFEVVFTWGPRPEAAQDVYVQMKSDGTEKADILEQMQRWYNADKGVSIQREFEVLVRRAGESNVAAHANS